MAAKYLSHSMVADISLLISKDITDLLFSTGSLVTYLPFPPFAFCYPFLRCSSLRYRPSVFRSLFYALLFFHIIMYAHVCVWRCCKFCKFASLPSVFPSFLVFRLLFSHAVHEDPSFGPSDIRKILSPVAAIKLVS